MQLRLSNEELNFLANLLLEEGETTQFRRDLLNKILARDLRLDTDELDAVHQLLVAEKHRLRESANHHGDAMADAELEQKLNLLERTIEKVDEACAML